MGLADVDRAVPLRVLLVLFARLRRGLPQRAADQCNMQYATCNRRRTRQQDTPHSWHSLQRAASWHSLQHTMCDASGRAWPAAPSTARISPTSFRRGPQHVSAALRSGCSQPLQVGRHDHDRRLRGHRRVHAPRAAVWPRAMPPRPAAEPAHNARMLTACRAALRCRRRPSHPCTRQPHRAAAVCLRACRELHQQASRRRRVRTDPPSPAARAHAHVTRLCCSPSAPTRHWAARGSRRYCSVVIMCGGAYYGFIIASIGQASRGADARDWRSWRRRGRVCGRS